jgi:hypothetical protein
MDYESFCGEGRHDHKPHCTECNDAGCDACCCNVHGCPIEECGGRDCEGIEAERADRVAQSEHVAEILAERRAVA